MSQDLRHRLRDELAKTYAPGAEIAMPELADQGFLAAVVETQAADVDLARREIVAVAGRLARGEISETELGVRSGGQTHRSGRQGAHQRVVA